MQIDPIRFWINVTITEDHWIWNAAKSKAGYGYFWDGETARSAHRISWALANGEIPPGMHLHHVCLTPSCVRPDHLELVTPGDHVHIHRPFPRDECSNGHPFDEGNTYHPPGRLERQCRACNAASKRRAYHRALVPAPAQEV